MTADRGVSDFLPHNFEMEPTYAIAAECFRSQRDSGWCAFEGQSPGQPVVHQIDDDLLARQATKVWFQCAGWAVVDYTSAEEFLAAPRPSREACLIVDVNLPGMNGINLLEVLSTESCPVPALVLTGRSDASTAVAALKAGASDFLEKPADRTLVLASARRAVEEARVRLSQDDLRSLAQTGLNRLTHREYEVLMMVLEGKPNKNIAADLGISQRTVESHRARVMQKTGSKSLPALVELCLLATGRAGHILPPQNSPTGPIESRLCARCRE